MCNLLELIRKKNEDVFYRVRKENLFLGIRIKFNFGSSLIVLDSGSKGKKGNVEEKCGHFN